MSTPPSAQTTTTSTGATKRPLPTEDRPELTTTGQSKKAKSNPLTQVGRYLVRTEEMFSLPISAIQHGMYRESIEDDDRADHSWE